jgi:hypothetical protein
VISVKRTIIIVSGAFVVLWLGLISLCAADTELNEVPFLTVKDQALFPVNWARASIGTRPMEPDVQVTECLLSESSTPYTIPAGEKTFILVLPLVQVLDRVNFYVLEGQGLFSLEASAVALSPRSNRWRAVVKPSALTPGKVLGAKFGALEAKYLKFTFKCSKPGRIQDLAIFGSATVSDYSGRFSGPAPVESVSRSSLKPFNFSKLLGGSRVVYVSSGKDLKRAQYLVDDDPSTGYTFNPKDATPTVVVDLGASRTLRKLSVDCSPQKGKLECYLMGKLPLEFIKPIAARWMSDIFAHSAPVYFQRVAFELSTQATTSGRKFGLNNSFFEKNRPAAVLQPNANGRASATISPTEARFMLMRWISGKAGDGAAPFHIDEIAAIGDIPPVGDDLAPVEGGPFQAQNILPQQSAQIPFVNNPQPGPGTSSPPPVPVVSP